MSTETKPAIQSLTLKSVAVIAVAFVANHFKVALPAGAAEQVVSSLIDLATTLGLIGAAIGRTRASTPIG
ncbi:MAG TPA: hypothetical protein VG841_07210 [Caulobacterales bacterium]|nr:hypothetical protein [Caulobacterales bacterium]